MRYCLSAGVMTNNILILNVSTNIQYEEQIYILYECALNKKRFLSDIIINTCMCCDDVEGPVHTCIFSPQRSNVSVPLSEIKVISDQTAITKRPANVV